MTNVFDPHLHVKTITIIGLGETGSQLVRIGSLIRFPCRHQ
jgi:phosphoglycerate dehydrogenase-like enzyme